MFDTDASRTLVQPVGLPKALRPMTKWALVAFLAVTLAACEHTPGPADNQGTLARIALAPSATTRNRTIAVDYITDLDVLAKVANGSVPEDLRQQALLRMAELGDHAPLVQELYGRPRNSQYYGLTRPSIWFQCASMNVLEDPSLLHEISKGKALGDRGGRPDVGGALAKIKLLLQEPQMQRHRLVFRSYCSRSAGLDVIEIWISAGGKSVAHKRWELATPSEIIDIQMRPASSVDGGRPVLEARREVNSIDVEPFLAEIRKVMANLER